MGLMRYHQQNQYMHMKVSEDKKKKKVESLFKEIIPKNKKAIQLIWGGKWSSKFVMPKRCQVT